MQTAVHIINRHMSQKSNAYNNIVDTTHNDVPH